MEHELLTVKEVAAYLRVSGMTVIRMIKAGRLEAIRPGRAWRVKAASVHALDSNSPKEGD